MADTFRIPADIAAHAISTAEAMERTARYLERQHEIFADEDKLDDDGTVWEWSVSLDHSAVERLIANTREVGKFLNWLGQFAENDAQPEPASLKK